MNPFYFFKQKMNFGKHLIVFINLMLIIVPCKDIAARNILEYEVVSPMKRIYKTTEVVTKNITLIELWSARNGYESVQIAFNSNYNLIVDNVSFTDLVGKTTGHIISKNNFYYRFSAYVFVNKNTERARTKELDGIAPMEFPDPLVKSSYLQFVGSRSIFLTWYIPPDTLPGNYMGELIFSLNSKKYSIPVIFHVWNFSLPEKPSLFVTNWLHSNQIESQFHVVSGSDEYWNIIDNVAKDMSSHRQNIVFTQLGLIKSIEMPDGNYTFDFSKYEKWVKIFTKHGIQIFEGSHLNSGYSYNAYRLVDNRLIRLDFGGNKIDTVAAKKFLRKYLRALNNENIKLGITKNYLQHIMDEPKQDQFDSYKEISTIVREAMPGVTIIDATDRPDILNNYMDIPVTELHKTIGKSMTEHVSKKWGKWWYTAVNPQEGGYPNRFIDFPLAKLRVIPWLNWRFGISGYLHYGYNWWYTYSGKSPWLDVGQSGKYPPGDGFIVYPPLDNEFSGLHSSLRWEAFRNGLQDYEYLIMLDRSKEVLSNDNNNYHKLNELKIRIVKIFIKVKNQVKSLEEYPKNPEELDTIRREIGIILNEINNYYGNKLLP